MSIPEIAPLITTTSEDKSILSIHYSKIHIFNTFEISDSQSPLLLKQEPPHPDWYPILHVCEDPSFYRAVGQRKGRMFSSKGSPNDTSGSMIHPN